MGNTASAQESDDGDGANATKRPSRVRRSEREEEDESVRRTHRLEGGVGTLRSVSRTPTSEVAPDQPSIPPVSRSQYVNYDQGPDHQALQDRYGVEFVQDGQAQRIQRLESEFGQERVSRWASEGMPIETMGKARDMEAFRNRQEERPAVVPDDIERRNANSAQRNTRGPGEDGLVGDVDAPDVIRRVVSSGGRSLDETAQREMEGTLGESFDDVRIHTGPQAVAAAESINARAFTVGNHVAFNSGEYRPETTEGKGVLAHELTHVRQQTDGTVSLLPKDDEVHPAAGARAGESTTIVNNGAEMYVQPKLEVSSPDDPAEQEAEAVAEKVVELDQSPGGVQASSGEFQGRGGEDETSVGSDSVNPSGTGGEVSEGAESAVRRGVQGDGKPIHPEVRSSFESTMNADFSDVQVHTDATADEAAKSINAEAYTMGSDIAFADGNYEPDSKAGKELLAHELTHVVQSGSVDRKVSDEDTEDEVSREMGAVSTSHRRVHREVSDDEQEMQFVDYEVERGDTLSHIAVDHDVEGGWPALWEENNTEEKNPKNPVKDPHHIEPGWELYVPQTPDEQEATGGSEPAGDHDAGGDLNEGGQPIDEITTVDLGDIESLDEFKTWVMNALTEMSERAEAMGKLEVSGALKITIPKLPILWAGVSFSGHIGGHDTFEGGLEPGVQVSIEDPFDLVGEIKLSQSYGLEIEGESLESAVELIGLAVYRIVKTTLDAALASTEFVGNAAEVVSESMMTGADNVDYWAPILSEYATRQIEEGGDAVDEFGAELGDDMEEIADDAIESVDTSTTLADQTLTALNESLSSRARGWADRARDTVDSVSHATGDMIDSARETARNKVSEASAGMGDWARRRFESMGLGGVGDAVGGVIDSGGKRANQFVDDAASTVSNAADTANSWFSSGLSLLGIGADKVMDKADETVSNAVRSGGELLNKGLSLFGEDGADWVRETARSVSDTIKGVGGSAVGAAERASDVITDEMRLFGETMDEVAEAEEQFRTTVRGEFAEHVMSEEEAEERLEELGDDDKMAIFQKGEVSGGIGNVVEAGVGLEMGTLMELSGSDGEAEWNPDAGARAALNFTVDAGYGVKADVFDASFAVSRMAASWSETEMDLNFTAPIGLELEPRTIQRYMTNQGLPLTQMLEDTGQSGDLLDYVEETGDDAIERLTDELEEYLPIILDAVLGPGTRDLVDTEEVTEELVSPIVEQMARNSLDAYIDDSFEVVIPWLPGMDDEDVEEYREARENDEDFGIPGYPTLFDAEYGFTWVWDWDEMRLRTEDMKGRIFKSNRTAFDIKAVEFDFSYQELLYEFDI